MKSNISTHRYRVSVLGPLHLGAGEDYLPTHYVIDDGYLHALSDGGLNQGLGQAGLEQLADLIGEGKPEEILQVRRTIHSKKDQLLPYSQRLIPVSRGVNQLYEDRVGKIAQREDNRNITNQLAIARCAYSLFKQQPLLTGTALKGAIRTACMAHWLQEKSTHNKKFEKSKNSNQLAKELLSYQSVEQDPFYRLKISDASYQQPDNLIATEVLFSVSQRRVPNPKKTAKALQTLLECISPWRHRAFSGDIRFVDINNERRDSNRVPSHLKALAEQCNSYYFPKLQQELQQLGKNAGYLSSTWVEIMTALCAPDSDFKQALDKGQAMLLRLGKYSGAVDKTLDGLRSIEIMTPRGQDSKYQSTTNEVRLAAKHKQDPELLPFGWVVVEFDDTTIASLQQLLNTASEPARQKLEEARQKQAMLTEAKVELQRKQQEQLQQKKAIEEQQQQKAQRQQELENMSEPQRLQAQLRDFIEQNPQLKNTGQPNNLIFEALSRMINQAISWQRPDQIDAKILMKETFDFLSINRKKSKAAKRLWEQLKDVE
ncbi:hypothetical protein GCM10011297_10400 [Bacterioplanes sanyensis]|uniref:hypothetical protein n=1 Tax=Bacterioplanes sanyensis TaxID=1249553 RepID=UPI0016743FE6|nr:hypothetical protein [Bacterioplanes sanyensis]GGY39118.1 hypothetical protein GCM10011297_10400 [Bacterioplanes sanyensis]